jgi:hypothetical protein
MDRRVFLEDRYCNRAKVFFFFFDMACDKVPGLSTNESTAGFLAWKYRPQIAPEPELPEYPEGPSKEWMQSR